MAIVLGIDVGSGYSKAVVLEEGQIRSFAVIPSGGNYREAGTAVAKAALDRIGTARSNVARTVAAGYGGNMVDFADGTSTDISCHAIGIHHLFPSVKTVMDVGAQYSRAIRLDNDGRIVNFIMNEKCAGGSGKFLQVAARILHIKVEDIGALSLTAQKPVEFTTGCAVFAESEAVSRISEGASPADILAGIHNAMASKIVTLAMRVGLDPDYAVTGGGAMDTGLVNSISTEISAKLFVPDDPQITAALGAALIAEEQLKKEARTFTVA